MTLYTNDTHFEPEQDVWERLQLEEAVRLSNEVPPMPIETLTDEEATEIYDDTNSN